VFPGSGWDQAGDRVRIHPGRAADMQQLLEMVLGEGQPPCRGVIHLWNLDAPGPEELTSESLDAAQEPGCLSIVHLVQAWNGFGMPPRLWLVTRGAQVIGSETGTVALAQSPVWGLGRVVMNEH